MHGNEKSKFIIIQEAFNGNWLINTSVSNLVLHLFMWKICAVLILITVRFEIWSSMFIIFISIFIETSETVLSWKSFVLSLLFCSLALVKIYFSFFFCKGNILQKEDIFQNIVIVLYFKINFTRNLLQQIIFCNMNKYCSIIKNNYLTVLNYSFEKNQIWHLILNYKITLK